MSRNRALTRSSRRGAVAVLVAALLIPILAFVALSVDIGWITLTRDELQSAADSAAAAAAQQLMSGSVQYSIPGATQGSILSTAETAATTYATQYSGFNAAGGVSSLSLNNADIQFGFTSANGTYSAGASGFPNTVKVVMRRDGSANGNLGLFFAPLLGVTSESLTATAAATIYTAGTISGFNSSAGVNGRLLPVTMDVNAWNTFMATGQSPDGTIHAGPNGAPQIQVYPSPGNAPGNFGLICVGTPSNSTPAFSSWIDSGPSPSDLEYLNSNGLVPVSASSPQQWKGGPGLKSALSSDFASVVGQPHMIPVFQPVSTSPYQAASGNGSNTYYNIVNLVGVTITQATGNGSNMNISVQPCSTLDPTAMYSTSSIVPALTGTQPGTLFTGVKLTQ
jgi:Flp pilus assembly protein TadG